MLMVFNDDTHEFVMNTTDFENCIEEKVGGDALSYLSENYVTTDEFFGVYDRAEILHKEITEKLAAIRKIITKAKIPPKVKDDLQFLLSDIGFPDVMSIFVN